MLPALYLAVALCVTTLLCFVTAPFGAPDEENQSLRALQLAHGSLVAEQDLTEAGGWIDLNAAKTIDGFDAVRMQWERRSGDFHDRRWGTMTEAAQQRLSGLRWAHRTIFARFGNTAVYPPFLYLPAIAGWRIGEALNLTIAQSLRLARLLSAWSASALGWLALRLCQRRRLVLFACLLLPSSLFLNASCSQDAVLLSVAALAVALLTRPLEGRSFMTRELVCLTALMTLMALARPPYLLLGFLLFLPSFGTRQRTSRWWIAPSLAFVVIVVVVLGWHHLVAPLGLDLADEADPALQLAFLREHPFRAAAALLRGTWTAADDFLRRGLYVLGWNDLLAPWWLRLGAALGLLGATLASPASLVRNWLGRALILLSIAGVLLGISLAEYLIWTPPGLATVYGIQPRYWLPVLPFGLLLVCGGRLRPRLGWATAMLVCSMACSVPFLAARMFYGEGLIRVLQGNVR